MFDSPKGLSGLHAAHRDLHAQRCLMAKNVWAGRHLSMSHLAAGILKTDLEMHRLCSLLHCGQSTQRGLARCQT